MPRGRPKKMKEQVSINGEELPAPQRLPEQERIAELEAKIKAFEARNSTAPEDKEFNYAPPKEKPKQVAKEASLPLVSEVTTRDMFEIEDRKPVTGVFRMQNKKPGERGMVRIGAIRKYKGDHMNPWIFEHGKTYTIPKWLADWLNGGETNPEDKVKSPRCNVIKHNDQWNDLQAKRPLSTPTLSPMYSFTPVAKW